jgi:ADP-ribose pyrophosphatase
MMRDERTPENAVEDRVVFACPWLTVREAVVDRGTGQTSWYYLDHPGCALVLPITEDGRVALIHIWRIAVHQWCWEAPAGRIEPSERPVDAARRELLEEIGGEGGDMLELGAAFTSSGSSTERVHLFVGRDVTLGGNRPDPDEELSVRLVTPVQALNLVRAGLIEDAPTALAIWWAHDRGLLDRGQAQ